MGKEGLGRSTKIDPTLELEEVFGEGRGDVSKTLSECGLSSK